MVSWDDGETSSEEPLFVGDGEWSDNPGVPNTVYDPDFCGIERHSEETCDHFEKLMKCVAFEGENTGRRFLGCARGGGGICSTVVWIDPEWPTHLKKALVSLWEEYEQESTARTKLACVESEKYYKLLKVNEELEEKVKYLQIDLGKAVGEGVGSRQMQIKLDLDVQVKELAGQQTAELVEENKKILQQKEEIEKERDVLKEEKKRLDYGIFDLLKAAEVHRQKLQKMKQIIEE